MKPLVRTDLLLLDLLLDLYLRELVCMWRQFMGTLKYPLTC